MLKISKSLARQLYYNNIPILILPNRINPHNAQADWIKKSQDTKGTFNDICSDIFERECSFDTGLALAYYIKEM